MEHCRKSKNLLFTDKLRTVSEPKVPNQSESSQLKLHISFSIRASVMLAVQLSKNHKLVMFYQEKNAAMLFDVFCFVSWSKSIVVRIPQDVIQHSGNQRRCETQSNFHEKSHVQYCS